MRKYGTRPFTFGSGTQDILNRQKVNKWQYKRYIFIVKGQIRGQRKYTVGKEKA